jgi:hypothetical protein
MTTTDTGSVPFYGMYKGICVNNVDPEGLFRLTAVVPQVFGDSTTASDWAWPCFPVVVGTTVQINAPLQVTGPIVRWQRVVPPPGTGVWISFEGGDVNAPIWHGTWT